MERPKQTVHPLFTKAVASVLRDLRASAGVSQRQIADGAGITQASVSNYEAGRREIGLGVFVACAHTCGVSGSNALDRVQAEYERLYRAEEAVS